ncbi:ATP-dependent protease ATPase subunit HslU [Thermanaerovibrio acidaminovorans]|uniref:ATP-dependent protease ATPase subunit HslU n=1 Tax=Thermanaerovibrio acidaminovorans (strain ATCC 49978 / DSM 6589 / Su883) TaxID=525903 RepID=D1B6D2_THEAS|nr:ATP-dependent protease ATPase subunit HslU [Thermanaerovibrio acidaminovorans]ACZ19573.1 heat shock protein HslVU, ATPase subunit HslU [Thermanaerovibrio acidaminovorans DSM 6589]
MMDLTPRMVVEYLDRHIVGQSKAKRAVAVALRNRIRRRRLPEELAREVYPKNILMVGPTGVGKTEIARRLAKLVGAPFVKVEATKFTEVGYVGRDVESMIRDLVEVAFQMVRSRRLEEVSPEARRRAEERVLDALLPSPKPRTEGLNFLKLLGVEGSQEEAAPEEPDERRSATREKLRELLRARKLDERTVEVEVFESPLPNVAVMGPMGGEGLDLGDMLGGLFPKRPRRKSMTVAKALEELEADEADKLLDRESLSREAVRLAEEEGIVFIDEMDKIASSGASHGPDVSREGVQRDLLPLVEGTVVNTKYGPVRTDHVLFIAAGAFHKVKPSDLAPELQGRFPIRVELEPLGEEDLYRILVEPQGSLTVQYGELLRTDGVELKFLDEGLREVAQMAHRMNREMEDIGARRLHTLMEMLLEDLSFEAPDGVRGEVTVDREYVASRVGGLLEERDPRRYLL